MNPPAWRELGAWQYHTTEFVEVRAELHPPVPVVEFRTDTRFEPWEPHDVRRHWLKLPLHPNLLSVLRLTASGVLVRYPALMWGREFTESERSLVRWGRQLIDVFSLVASDLSVGEELGLFVRPHVKIDLGGHARVAFLPVQKGDEVFTGLPKDIRRRWPACDQSALVFAIGRVLQALWKGDDATLEVIIKRATEANAGRRFGTLADLRLELENMTRGEAIRRGNAIVAWDAFEEGAGWWDLERPAKAMECFQNAFSVDPELTLAREAFEYLALRHAMAERAVGPWKPMSRPKRPTRAPAGQTWESAEPQALAFETQRDFRAALEIYRAVRPDARSNLAVYTARARCHLELGEHGEAIDFAQRALAIIPDHAGAYETLVTAMLARHWHQDALRNAEQFVAVVPGSARAHFLLGKALFVNGRIPDAGDAFARAIELDPKLLEAQLLLREVHRVTGNVRKSVGSQHAPTFELPEQLAELRDVLVSGDTGAAITALRDERYARDADAQLLLARFLAFDRRLDEAIAVYGQLEATSHRTAALVGKATALLDLGRAGDALSIFEQLPDDADAAEGQARALEALGRVDEAAEAYRRFIALTSSGSDLRVRAAELWLAERAGQR